LEKRRRHCSSTSKRDRSKKGAVDADADDEDSSSDENQNHISDDEGVLDAKGIFQKFLDSLWDTLPSHAVYLRKPLPDPTPVFSHSTSLLPGTPLGRVGSIGIFLASTTAESTWKGRDGYP